MVGVLSGNPVRVIDDYRLPELIFSIQPELVQGGGPDTAASIVRVAQAAGWRDQPTTLGGSVALLVWPFLPLVGSVFSISIGGEVRNARRSQLFGMVGSLVTCVGAFVVVAILADKTLGADLQGGSGFIWDTAATQTEVGGGLRFLAEPWFPALVGLGTSNIGLRALVGIGFTCWVYFWLPGVLAYVSRAMLAWALDRAVPDQIGLLHRRFATPWVTYVIGGAVTNTFLLLILYTQFFATLIFIQAATIAWCVALALGVFFPWRRPQLFSQTPAGAWRLGTLPVISILNLLGAISLGLASYLLWNDDLAAGHSVKSFLVVGTTFSLGILIFFVMSAIRNRQGMAIVRAYKEIPVE